MMFGKSADFNRDMYQINIASIDVIMQLVQVVDSMREGQGVIMDALERMSDDGDGGSQGDLMMARQSETNIKPNHNSRNTPLVTLSRLLLPFSMRSKIF